MAFWVATSTVVIVVLMLNARRPGAVLAAAGTLLNLDVVLANGAMPVMPPRGIIVLAANVASASGGFYQLARIGTAAVWAGDVLPANLFGQSYLVSVGDLLLAVGVAVFVSDSMLLNLNVLSD